MIEKNSFKNYLELIDFENQDFQTNLDIDLLKKNDKTSQAYPFQKNQLLSYLVTSEFLESIEYDFENGIIKKKEGNIILPTQLSKLEFKKIIDKIPEEIKKKEIKKEKRKRYQAYTMLSYFLSQSSYFDFLSFDAFELAKNAKFLTQNSSLKTVSLEIFLLTFFDSEFQISKLLQEFGFNVSFVEKNCLKNLSKQILAKQEETDFSILNWFKSINPVGRFENEDPDEETSFLNQNILYSGELNFLFEKSATNALERFKTPIITPEILFITLMEEKNLSVNKLIRKILKEETNWYLLRYKLLKRVYYQESNLRNQIEKNQHFFAYFLRTKIVDSDFNELIKNKKLNTSVLKFRDQLISDILKNNVFDDFFYETYLSILSSPTRSYSVE